MSPETLVRLVKKELPEGWDAEVYGPQHPLTVVVMLPAWGCATIDFKRRVWDYGRGHPHITSYTAVPGGVGLRWREKMVAACVDGLKKVYDGDNS